jgi:hypothetical protein
VPYRKSGWWLSHPSEKYDLVSWDDSSQLNGQKKNPNHHNGTTNSGKKKRDKEPESPGQY